MIVVRCSARLARSSRIRLVDDPPRPSAPLGEWYATIVPLPFRGKDLVVFVHRDTRIVVATSGRTLRGTLPQLRERLPVLLRRLGIPDAKIRQQERAMGEAIFAPTADNELLASLTHSSNIIRNIADEATSAAAFDLDAVEDELAEFPFPGLDLTPGLAVRELLIARTLR